MSSSAVDMSAKVGGRVFQPALPVVDGSPPNELEQGFQRTLENFTDDNIPLESTQGMKTRERVLIHLEKTCRDWIRYECTRKGLPAEVVEAAGGQVFTSGSYRLNVAEPGADIDCILVAPRVVAREDFFGTAHVTEENQARDPQSLAERIRGHPDVTNFVPVEGAAVPILTFDWEGINIDLLFARLNSNSAPKDKMDINNDAILDGVDSATEKSLNGPRVTNLIEAFVRGTPQRYQTFLAVVRCVRKWAKNRGLYSNKMGYWGGVNINIAVAQCLQLYPNASPATLLRRFFLVFKTWRWPQPVMLTKPHDAGYGLAVWSPTTAVRQVAPMITPAYPAMNSTLSVSRQTLQIMQEEFNRGHAIIDKLWREFQANPKATELDWASLFRPSDFFIAFPNYLSLCIVGPSQADAQAWAGFVESRLRKLVSDLLARSLPLKKIQLWPKKIEACIADPSALLTAAQRKNSITYFIGIRVDKGRMRGEQLNAEIPLHNFREWELSRFSPLITGMDVLVKNFKVKELPLICFDQMYEGGKKEAMARRRELLDNDPARQERKRLKRLEELRIKMEEIKKKKEDKKRKRDEVEIEALEKEVKEEEAAIDSGEQAGQEMNAETDLLESAFDTMNEGKTREEAEADRQKLLTGELIGEGETQGDIDDEDYIARQVYAAPKSGNDTNEEQGDESKRTRTMRSLLIPEERAEMLRQLGYPVVSDEECEKLGSVMPPWTSAPLDDSVPSSRARIVFREQFDIVELDANGHVIDKGDEDFEPSKKWIGRKAGFEFKLGARGLGYYRTGKKVVVPSNTAY